MIGNPPRAPIPSVKAFMSKNIILESTNNHFQNNWSDIIKIVLLQTDGKINGSFLVSNDIVVVYEGFVWRKRIFKKNEYYESFVNGLEK